MTHRVYVGIDAGGTGTRAAVARADGTLLGFSKAGPSGSAGGSTGQRVLRRALDSVLTPLLPAIGSLPCAVHLGLRGLSIAGRREAALALLAERLPPAEVSVSNDALIALEGALASQPGVAVLAGTGSIALARRADGVEVRSGGFGYLVGDEGSGFWLGRKAVAASLRSFEQNGPPTMLGELLCAALGLESVADLVPWVYRARQPAPRLASLAPLVARAASDGDSVATALLQQAAGHLAELAVAVTRKAWPESLPDALLVARCGGVWSAGPPLVEPFEAALRAAMPAAQSVPPRLPPVCGAILRAMVTDRMRLDLAVVEALERTFATV